MRLFNTLTQRIEPLEPTGNRVTLYVCGITPYDTTHLGHAFINVIYDTLARYLRWRGRDVLYVQNVTDIDDDMLRKAKELDLAWDELGRQEVTRYLADLRALNVRMPDHYVWASRETAKMQELIAALISKGLAYVRDGWVYYAVERDPGFGVLADAAGYIGYDAWLRTANERGNFPDDPRKRNPLDFVLWQGRQPGEPAWPSPWGPGRPGWHIECSAMALKYLGETVDIHGGGADLIFPHHTCEIAQSENATGVRPFVRVWMHCAMVEYASEKMSKSLGNLVRVRELLPEYSADAVRVMLLSHHYRDAWEYTAEDMRASAALAGRLRAAASCEPARGDEAQWERDAACQQAYLEMVAALEDDFQTPRALAALDRLAAHTLEVRAPAQIATLRELAGVLGLRLGAEADEEEEEEEPPLLCAAGEAPLPEEG